MIRSREALTQRVQMKTNIIVKNREDQEMWDLLGSVGRELSKEIKSRNFKNDESMEVCLDLICLDVANRLGAVFESTKDGLLFDFTDTYIRRPDVWKLNDPSLQNVSGSLADTIAKKFFW